MQITLRPVPTLRRANLCKSPTFYTLRHRKSTIFGPNTSFCNIPPASALILITPIFFTGSSSRQAIKIAPFRVRYFNLQQTKLQNNFAQKTAVLESRSVLTLIKFSKTAKSRTTTQNSSYWSILLHTRGSYLNITFARVYVQHKHYILNSRSLRDLLRNKS